MSGITPIEPARGLVAAHGSAQAPAASGTPQEPATLLGAGLYRVPGNPALELARPSPAAHRIPLPTPAPARPTRAAKPHVDGTPWTPERARAACKAFSDDAAARGIDVLVLGFEGLVSFDERGTAEAYAWAAGRRREPPREALASGYVLHGLIRPLVERHGDRIEFLVWPHEAENGNPDGLPATCARIWQEHSPRRRLVVAGHSMGGASASSLARTLAQSGTRLDLMVAIDAVSTPRTPLQRWNSTTQVFNFPRVARLPWFGTIEGADLQTRIPDSHVGVPGHPVVVDAVSRAIDALISPEVRALRAKP